MTRPRLLRDCTVPVRAGMTFAEAMAAWRALIHARRAHRATAPGARAAQTPLDSGADEAQGGITMTIKPLSSYITAPDFADRCRALQREAAAAGDLDTVATCALALRGHATARWTIAEILSYADAQT